MTGKKLFLMPLVVAVILLQFADCIATFSQDQQAMQCCGSFSCTSTSESHDCCKTMASPAIPKMLVPARISLIVPIIADVPHARGLETAKFTLPISVSFKVPEHSPPELYTLNRSLLI
jgi:hypothetical protein